MIRVLVVEDSAVARDFLVHILSSDPEIEVAGTAFDGEAAVEAVERTRPDVITMDLHMPRMNGIDATRRIMEIRPTPIVIVSGSPNVSEKMTAFRAIEAGALAVVPRPVGLGNSDFEADAANLVRTVRLMSEVKVIRRWRHRSTNGGPPVLEPHSPGLALVAIGGSTGGPPALHGILSHLPALFPAPIVVVQHIAPGFAEGLAEWMRKAGSLPVHLATHGQLMLPGNVYLAPDGHHLEVAIGNRLLLTREPPENGLRPSVSVLFRSVAKVYGARGAGVLLSGMGMDGSAEMKLMRDLGAMTIAQDKATSVVHGMPGEAIRLGGATYVLPQEKIAYAIASMAGTFASPCNRAE